VRLAQARRAPEGVWAASALNYARGKTVDCCEWLIRSFLCQVEV
jgi:hypothetical protein